MINHPFDFVDDPDEDYIEPQGDQFDNNPECDEFYEDPDNNDMPPVAPARPAITRPPAGSPGMVPRPPKHAGPSQEPPLRLPPQITARQPPGYC